MWGTGHKRLLLVSCCCYTVVQHTMSTNLPVLYIVFVALGAREIPYGRGNQTRDGRHHLVEEKIKVQHYRKLMHWVF